MKKQYKIKYENGQIKPLEPVDIKDQMEGLVIFLEEDTPHSSNDIKSLMEMAGSINAEPTYKKLTSEFIDSDSTVYDE